MADAWPRSQFTPIVGQGGATASRGEVSPMPEAHPSIALAITRSSGVVTLMLLRAPSNVRTSTPMRSTIAASSVTSSATPAWARSRTVAAEDLGRLYHRQFAAVERLDDASASPATRLMVSNAGTTAMAAPVVSGGGETVLDHAGRHERARAVVYEYPIALRREGVEPRPDAVLPPRAADKRGHRLAASPYRHRAAQQRRSGCAPRRRARRRRPHRSARRRRPYER